MDLKSGRKEIDQIDIALVRLLNKRFDIAKKLIPYKKSITDKKREKVVIMRAKGLKSIFKAIVKETKKRLR
jgi:chorismate mutase